MDDGGIFGKMFDESEQEPRSCVSCNSGVKTDSGLLCCINKTKECLPNGVYKFWTPIVEFGDEFDFD